ncbi:MAG: S-layer homology domain-containing protein, partial [Clostridiaceae bacterium]|nr:S-layer homology domain-containing protein [Clostridiaceae bacterium]
IKDFDKVANWAKDAVKKVVDKGIMIGDDQGFFNPLQPCTRQELAVIVSRLLELIE